MLNWIQFHMWFGSNYAAKKKNRYKDQKEIINRDFVIIFSGL